VSLYKRSEFRTFHNPREMATFGMHKPLQYSGGYAPRPQNNEALWAAFFKDNCGSSIKRKM
jgi:hypothetical protein